jgi:hypothetical protein
MAAINPGCVWTKIPYEVDFHVLRGRKLRHETVWEENPLSFRAPTFAEAPVIGGIPCVMNSLLTVSSL